MSPFSLFWVGLALLMLLWLVVGYRISTQLLYPTRQRITRTPTEVGLAYEEITFASKDRVRLHGWWIPAASASHLAVPTVILLHPHLGNRHGLVAQTQRWPFRIDADIDLLAIAKKFHQAGYAVLMFDFRNHGASASGLCTGGFTEDQDVLAAVDYVFERMADERVLAQDITEKPSVGIVGYGMGATAALVAAGREKGGTEVLRVFSGDSAGGSGFITIPPLSVKYLRFLVAIEPMSQATYLRGYLRQRMWGVDHLLLPLVDYFCQRRGGYPLSATPLFRFLRAADVPVLNVRSASQTDACEAQSIYDALPGPKQLWEVNVASAPQVTYRYVGAQLETLLDFAERAFRI